MAAFFFAVWMSVIFTAGLCCPESCTCSDKYGRHFAECSYKDLIEVPDDLPPNATTVSLSANKISTILLGSFENVTQVTSLWMTRNQIHSVERGSLGSLVHLRNFDISHNQLVLFPWEDLQNLTALEMLKMNHNQLTVVPKDAFSNLKLLRSLRLNNNKLLTVTAGMFDGLVSLSYVQIYNNPFECTCFLDWLRDWISSTTVSVPDQSLITCASPEEVKGELVTKLPKSTCQEPNVTILMEPQTLYEDSELVLTCKFEGNPKPLVMWNISSSEQKLELSLLLTGDFTNEYSISPKVFKNGTLVIAKLRLEDSGNYSCSATNEFGGTEETVIVKVEARPTPTPMKIITTLAYIETNPTEHPQTEKMSLFDFVPKLRRDDSLIKSLTVRPTAEAGFQFHKETNYQHVPSKCGLTENSRNVSSYVLNSSLDRSLDSMKQFTFDFGMIALGVSETEAAVRLNSAMMSKDQSPERAAIASGSLTDNKDNLGFPNVSSMYLCIASDRKHSALQWSQITEGVNIYLFNGLTPGTNYSLCVTYRGEDCEVQVLFTTKRRIPNLLIIITVSICLLTVSTVPLLGATCFHLVYKYRSKTYKLILKAKDQYRLDKDLVANMRPALTESQRRINEEEEEEGAESVDDGEKEQHTEESIMSDSFLTPHCMEQADECEVSSECSDRLPLGAEAVNIISNYNYLKE